MKKVFITIICILFISTGLVDAATPFNYDLNKDINRDITPGNNQNNPPQENVEAPQFYADGNNEWTYATSYYPNATLSSAITKYKRGNYSGSLQELISLTKKDPYNPMVFYYLGMAYTQAGNRQQAINAYETVMRMHASEKLTQYATKGRDCLVGGPACYTSEMDYDNIPQDDMDRFINAPYGNGLSKELKQQMKQQELRDIEKRIKVKDVLPDKDIEKIQKFDKNKSDNDVNNEKLAMADNTDVSNEDILQAIETLKKAGVTVTINPYQQQFPMNDEYAQMSMMLGANNYNNNNSMMNMLPMLMSQNNGQKIDPQVIQAMMMNSMLPDFTFNDNKKDY